MGIGGLPKVFAAGLCHPKEPAYEEPWCIPTSPSRLEGEAAERYRRGMSPQASLEDQVFYLSCRFDGHQEVIHRMQGDIFDLMGRNRKNVKRAWQARRIRTGDGGAG